jgi:quercetin dioxygenase-like cupin family protein
MKIYNWNALDEEQLNARITRRMFHTPRLTVARLHLQKYATVPEHSHEHEQVTTVERGALQFTVAGVRQVVRAGESLALSSGEPHAVEALEDTLVIDVFSPAREDWISGDDAYLRQ